VNHGYKFLKENLYHPRSWVVNQKITDGIEIGGSALDCLKILGMKWVVSTDVKCNYCIIAKVVGG
jgi:hypothetical protein